MSIMDQIMAKGINDMASKIKSLEARCEQLECENAELLSELEDLEEENETLNSLMLSGEKRGVAKATEEFKEQIKALKDELKEHSELLILQVKAITIAYRIASAEPVDKAICEALEFAVDGAKERLEQFIIEQRAIGVEEWCNQIYPHTWGRMQQGVMGAVHDARNFANRLRTNAGGK